MLDTKRKGLLSFLGDVITDNRDTGKPYLPFILNPSALISQAPLPPLFLVTSREDMLLTDTIKFDRLLTEAGVEHTLLNFPKGKRNKLAHVFSVLYPLWPDSRTTYTFIDRFFKSH